VLGADGRGALERAVRGTVWCRMATRAGCPVVVVALGARVTGAGRVGAGYDGSQHAERPLLVAARLAARLVENLLIVRADDERDVPPIDSAAEARGREVAGAAARRRGRRPPDPFDVEALCVPGHDDPAQALESAAIATGAGLLVTGSRGRGSWQ
jgi:nucleotide-binding universal stress UspA family protein